MALEELGHNVYQTRTGDIDDDGLSWRCSLANDAAADLFISIHCNAAENPATQGVEVFHCEGSTLGKLLAEYMLDTLAASG